MRVKSVCTRLTCGSLKLKLNRYVLVWIYNPYGLIPLRYRPNRYILIKYLNDMYKNVESVRAGLDIQFNLYELILLVCTDSKA